MSLLGVVTKTPGRPPGRARTAGLAPLPRVEERGRDNVVLLYLFPADRVTDHVGRRLVGVDRDDLDLADVLGPGLDAEDVEFLADGEAVVRADRDLHRAPGRVELGDLPLYGRRDRVRVEAVHLFGRDAHLVEVGDGPAVEAP